MVKSILAQILSGNRLLRNVNFSISKQNEMGAFSKLFLVKRSRGECYMGTTVKEDLIRFSERTVLVSDCLDKLYRHMPEYLAHKNVNYFETFYYIFQQLNSDTSQIQELAFSSTLRELEEALTGLPLFYHIQALKAFLNRQTSPSLDASELENAKKMASVFDEVAQEITKYLDDYVSPVEVILLVLLTFINKPEKLPDEATNSLKMAVKEPAIQLEGFKIFLQQYDNHYSVMLRSEVFDE